MVIFCWFLLGSQSNHDPGPLPPEVVGTFIVVEMADKAGQLFFAHKGDPGPRVSKLRFNV